MYITQTAFTYEGRIDISVHGLNARIPYTADSGILFLQKFVFSYPAQAMNNILGSIVGLNLVPGYDYGEVPSGGAWTITVTAGDYSFTGNVFISPGKTPSYPNFMFRTVDQNYYLPPEWIFT